MQWELISKKEVLSTPPFAVEELDLKNVNGSKPTHPYYRMLCPDWVNILPITRDGQAILIKQSRTGVFADVLEVPGGVVDPHEGRDVTMAAVRELEEETGYTSQRVLSLGSICPNPALQNNKLHMFVALDCHIAPQRQHFPDAAEQIEVILTDSKELNQLVRFGKMNSCLSCLTVMLAARYVNIGE